MGKALTDAVLAPQPMSVGQRALWFHQQADPASNAYNLGACFRFPRPIDAAFLDRALRLAGERHPLLRARFDAIDGDACWWIAQAPTTCTSLPGDDLSLNDAVARLEQFVLRPYDLARDPPFRFGLQAVEAGCILAIGCHHIVADLHSLAALVQELATGDGGAGTSQEAASYADFAREQGEFAASQAGAEAAAYWREQLAAVPPVQGLGALESGIPLPAGPAARVDFKIDGGIAAAVRALANRCGASEFAYLLTAFQVLLARHAGRDTVVVGAPSAGRADPRFRRTLGYLVNLLPLVFRGGHSEAFADVLRRNGAAVRAALRRGRFPFASMAHGTPALASGLIEATISYQKTVGGLDADLTHVALGLPGGRISLAGQIGELVPIAEPRAQFPLGLALAPVGDGFAGSLQFDPCRISPEAANNFLREWQALVRACCDAPGDSLGGLLDRVAGRPLGGPADTLLAGIEDVFALHGDRPVLRDAETQLSYRELEARSRAVAAALQARGIGPGDRVAVIGDGSIRTVVSLIGVMRSGAAFVPMDAETSPDRVRELQQTARVAAVLGGEDQAPSSAKLGPVRVEPADPAWLMFTSGTTGRPKAAVVPHAAALAHARGIARRFGLAPGDRVLQFASVSFDEHAEEIFPTLLAGACIVCLPKIRYEDPERLLQQVRQHAVTVLHLPTSYWHLWCDELAQEPRALPASLRLVNAGGEQASLSRLRQWERCAPASVHWFNSYGLTEAAVTSLLFELRPGLLDDLTAVPVGTPLPGCRVRIVGEDGRDVAPGATGELLLGGTGVGSGYFEAHEATAARFFTEAGVRWMRTGDLARVLDGQVVIVGRRDRTVKLHGARIDLSEAEAALAGHPAVLECALAPGPAGEALQAYAVLRPGHGLGAGEVQALLQSSLPPNAPPVRLHLLHAIPRTPGRKPDYVALAAALPQPLEPDTPHPPRDAEEIVRAIFERLLDCRRVDGDASFFGLGGHSLLAMRAVAALRRELSVELSVADFLADPTVRGVTATCRARGARLADRREPEAPAPRFYPLSDAQRQVLAAAELAPEALSHFRWMLRITGEVELPRLQRAWAAVLRAHPLLSARIDASGNRELAAAGEGLPMPLLQPDFPRTATRQQRLAAIGTVHAGVPGAARTAASLFRLSSNEHVLAVEARLAAADGNSIPLLLETFIRGYAQEGDRAQTPASYARFVQAQSDWLASPARDAARAWWRDRLDAAPTPTWVGRMRGSANLASRRLRCKLAPEVCRSVLALAAAQESSPFAALLAGFLVLLARRVGSADIVIGVPVSLRDRLGAPDACGPTLNALPFRARVDLRESFATLVQRTHAELATALEHSPLPYEEIVAASDALRGAPLPIQFVGQPTLPPASVGGVRIESELQARDGVSPAGLLVSVRAGATGIALEFEYRRDTLDDADAAALMRSYRILLAELRANPDRPVGAARMVPWGQIRAAMSTRPGSAPCGGAALLHAGLRAGRIAHPQRLALVCGDARLTYAELDEWTDKHARRLLAAGVECGDRVAVLSRTGWEEVVAACAVLKAGATYVPISHDMPAERAARLVARVHARIATGDGRLAPAWAGAPNLPFVPVSREQGISAPALPEVEPSSSAYILFTSGSTGEPKGVEVSHGAAMTTINEVLARFAIGMDDVLYRQAALGFDLSVFDIFGAFSAGATLVIPHHDGRGDAFAWADDVRRQQVTVWNSVPGALDMLLEAAPPQGLPSLRHVLASGDWIPLDLPERTRAASPLARFVGLGGATEASIWSCFHEVRSVDPAWRSIPYGRALGGQSMFVADEHGWPVPRGTTGEICIGGAALARGYWGDPARTAARFPVHQATGNRIYRTGDLGRCLPDGEIEILGRMDAQVKVRGTRIDLREVEQVLAQHPGVRRALVVPLTASDGRAVEAIGAYVLEEDGHQMDPEGLRHHALRHLGPAMRPSAYARIASLPLTANGKIDWSALPRMQAGVRSEPQPKEPPATPAEQALFAIWSELLPGASFGRHDNFFALGGHSLLAMRLLARVRRDTGRDVPLGPWLEQPTIAKLADLLEGIEPRRPVAAKCRARELRGRVHLHDDLVFSAPRSTAGACVVTGATGLIGSRIVARLLKRSEHEVICIDRAPQRDVPLRDRVARLLAGADPSWSDRLRCIPGDLALPRFGLGEADFGALARKAAWVFHAGAQVSLAAPYGVLAPANVAGTHEAIRLAALGGSMLCHVSSVGVVPYGAGRMVLEDEPLDHDGELLTGYCQTKWVAEQMVRAAMARGLRAVVFRPGLTVGDAGTSAERDLLALLVALSRRAGYLPATDFSVDLVDADYAAAAIEHIAQDARAAGRTFHLTHPSPVDLPELRDLVAPGIPVRPFCEWQRLVAAHAATIADGRLAAVAALLAQHGEDEITPARIACGNTDALLQGSGITCAPVADILARYLERMA